MKGEAVSIFAIFPLDLEFLSYDLVGNFWKKKLLLLRLAVLKSSLTVLFNISGNTEEGWRREEEKEERKGATSDPNIFFTLERTRFPEDCRMPWQSTRVKVLHLMKCVCFMNQLLALGNGKPPFQKCADSQT